MQRHVARRNRADSYRETSKDLIRSSLDSLAAILAAKRSMSLVPLAPFLDFARNDKQELWARATLRGLVSMLSARRAVPTMR